MSETYELSTLRIIVKRTIEQKSEEADTLYLIPGSAFARYEEGAFYREFAQLFNYDSGTPWAHDGFIIQERRSVTEWGGSGFLWEILVTAGPHVPTAVITFGVTKVLEALVKRVGTRAGEPITRDEALHEATWAILLANRQLKRDELEEVHSEEEDRSNGSFRFTFRPTDGYEYAASIGSVAGVPQVTAVSRTARS